VRPFPRPIELDERSLELLPEIAAFGAPGKNRQKRVVVLPTGTSARSHVPLRASMTVFPERDASGMRMLQHLTEGDAIVRLAEQTFNFPSHERTAIDCLTRLMRGADAYALIADDPREAAAAVLDVFPGRRSYATHSGPEEQQHSLLVL
jgi:hypothetical protein